MLNEKNQKFIKKHKFFIAFFSIAIILTVWNFTLGPTTPEWQYRDMVEYAETTGFECESETGVPDNYYSGVILVTDPLPPSMLFGTMLDERQQDEIKEILHDRIKLLPCYDTYLIGTGENLN